MSDLFQLVCETLRDPVLLEAQEEIRRLREIEINAQSVEIVHIPLEGGGEAEDQPFKVIASGSIVKDGKYNTNSRYGEPIPCWEISLSQMNPFPLANLKEYRLQVGGGYDYGSLWLEGEQEQGDDRLTNVRAKFSDLDTRSSFSLSIRAQNGFRCAWISCVVHNWPTWHRERDSPFTSCSRFITHGPYCIQYLSEIVAERHPNATIEFLTVSLDRSGMQPAMQRLIPRAKLIEARKQRADAPASRILFDDDPVVDFAIRRYQLFATPEQKADPDHLNGLRFTLEGMDVFVRFPHEPDGLSTYAKICIEQMTLNYIDHSREEFQTSIVPRFLQEQREFYMHNADNTDSDEEMD